MGNRDVVFVHRTYIHSRDRSSRQPGFGVFLVSVPAWTLLVFGALSEASTPCRCFKLSEMATKKGVFILHLSGGELLEGFGRPQCGSKIMLLFSNSGYWIDSPPFMP